MSARSETFLCENCGDEVELQIAGDDFDLLTPMWGNDRLIVRCARCGPVEEKPQQ